MARPRLVTDRKKLIAALLHSEGLSNKAIGERVRLSESAISKTLAECYRDNLLRITFHSGYSDGDLQTLRAEAGLSNEFTSLLRRFPKDRSAVVTEPAVMVFDSGAAQTSDHAWSQRLDTFAKAVRHEILTLILACRVVGTSWGRTLATIVRAMKDSTLPVRSSPITFIPLCGEPLSGSPHKTSASNLAYRLDEIVNQPAHLHYRWLGGVPSHLPIAGRASGLSSRETAVVQKYIRSIATYRDIFGGAESPPLVQRVDMILTSCSPTHRPLGHDGAAWFKATGVSLRDVEDSIVGDISGNLLPNPKARGRGRARLDQVNAAWLGATLAHLRACAARALENRLPGVVVCCIGANKAETLREVVRLGLANRILTDHDCWKKLQELL
jgi:DNA-binding transcriptional regulator LsrR (DeoR family)